jgi:hypothetical protein
MLSATRSVSLRTDVKDVGSSSFLVMWWTRLRGDPGGPPYEVTAISCRGLQTVSDGLANKGDFEPTIWLLREWH